jgi:hypothetical protein
MDGCTDWQMLVYVFGQWVAKVMTTDFHPGVEIPPEVGVYWRSGGICIGTFSGTFLYYSPFPKMYSIS